MKFLWWSIMISWRTTKLLSYRKSWFRLSFESSICLYFVVLTIVGHKKQVIVSLIFTVACFNQLFFAVIALFGFFLFTILFRILRMISFGRWSLTIVLHSSPCCISVKCTCANVNASFLFSDKPEFTSHPQPRTVNEGSTVTFRCDADGKPPPSFFWTKDGCELNASLDDRITFSEDTKRLSIMDVKRTDGGNYGCKATNDVKSVDSKLATLTVHCKDTFIHF